MTSGKGKLLIGLALLSLASTGLAYGPQRGGPGYGGGYRMAQELNLTAEQQEQIQVIMQQHRAEGQQWRKQHRNELETKMSGVLSDEQLEKFKSIKQQKAYGRGMGPRGQGPYGRNQGGCMMNPN